MEAELQNNSIKKKSFIDWLCYGFTFILIFLSFAYKNERLVLYSFEVLYILLILLVAFKQNKKISLYTFWSAAFFMICLLSYIWSIDQIVAAKQIFNILKVLLIGNALVLFLDNKEERINFILLTITLVAVYTTVLLVINTPANDWGNARLGESIGLNANDLALKMAISSIISVYLGKVNKKNYYFLFAIIFTIITFLTGSRKAFFMIIIGLIFLYTTNLKNKRNIIIIIPIMLIISFSSWKLIMTVPQLYDVLGERMEQMLNAFLGQGEVDQSTLDRLNMINTGISLFKERPLIGYGVSNFSVLTIHAYAHNNYVELLVSVGLLGTLLYYSLYVWIIFKMLKLKGKNAGLIISLIIGLVVMEYGQVTYYIEIYQIIIAFAFSACLNTSNIFKKSQD
jgi:O-antigen ligase